MSLANEANWSGSTRAAGRKTMFQARVDNLIQAFLNLKPDMELRRYMLLLVRSDGSYCQTCSPVLAVGACGRTCPLLRPHGGRGIAMSASETWRRENLDILRRYKVITDGLKQHGYNVSMSELVQWEQEAEEMQWYDVDEVVDRQSREPLSINVSFAEIDWQHGASREQWEALSPRS